MATDITQTTEDAHELANGTSYGDGTTLKCEAALVDTARWLAAMRFANVQLPKTATLTAAYMQVVFPVIQRDSPDVNIRANDVDDANDFATEPDVASRARTTNYVNWHGTDLGYGSFVDGPSIISVIEEVQDRGDWSAGQAMMIFADGDTVAGQEDGCRLTPNNTTPANACILHLEYDPAGGGPPPTPPPAQEGNTLPKLIAMKHRRARQRH